MREPVAKRARAAYLSLQGWAKRNWMWLPFVPLLCFALFLIVWSLRGPEPGAPDAGLVASSVPGVQEVLTDWKDRDRLLAAQKDTPDVIAWLRIPGTDLDEAVVQGPDNDTYLRRNVLGEDDKYGCVFADYECRIGADELSRSLILYGHTFDEDRTIGFGPLHDYQKMDFGLAHPLLYVTLPDAVLTYQVCSVGCVDTTRDADCIAADPGDAAFQVLFDKALNRSIYNYCVPLTLQDHVLTLSTCTNAPTTRLLVVAKLLTNTPIQP